MLFLLFIGNTGKVEDSQIITRSQGILLILFNIIYVIYTIYEERNVRNKKLDEEIIKDVEKNQIETTNLIVIYMILRNIRS